MKSRPEIPIIMALREKLTRIEQSNAGKPVLAEILSDIQEDVYELYTALGIPKEEK